MHGWGWVLQPSGRPRPARPAPPSLEYKVMAPAACYENDLPMETCASP